MGRGKNKQKRQHPQTIHIEELEIENKVEIDYAKLAEAIVKANKLSKDDVREAVCDGILQANTQINPSVPVEKKVGFWKKVWWIIRGEGSKDGRYSSGIFAGLLETVFNGLALLSIALFLLVISSVIYTAIHSEWTRVSIFANIIAIIVGGAYGVLCAVFALMFRGAANDMKLEKDRNYIIALFSGVVSLVALIVSFVALAKG